MTVYMVVDREAVREGVFARETFVENREAMDPSHRRLYINSFVDVALCPPNAFVVMAVASNLWDWSTPDRTSYRSHECEEQRQREASRMPDQVEPRIPGFGEGALGALNDARAYCW